MKREMADKALTIILLCKFRNFVRRMWGHIVLQKDSVTIISNNCIGGVLCHDFGLQFCSPFVNTNISMEHYLQICIWNIVDTCGYLSHTHLCGRETQRNYI